MLPQPRLVALVLAARFTMRILALATSPCRNARCLRGPPRPPAWCREMLYRWKVRSRGSGSLQKLLRQLLEEQQRSILPRMVRPMLSLAGSASTTWAAAATETLMRSKPCAFTRTQSASARTQALNISTVLLARPATRIATTWQRRTELTKCLERHAMMPPSKECRDFQALPMPCHRSSGPRVAPVSANCLASATRCPWGQSGAAADLEMIERSILQWPYASPEFSTVGAALTLGRQFPIQRLYHNKFEDPAIGVGTPLPLHSAAVAEVAAENWPLHCTFSFRCGRAVEWLDCMMTMSQIGSVQPLLRRIMT